MRAASTRTVPAGERTLAGEYAVGRMVETDTQPQLSRRGRDADVLVDGASQAAGSTVAYDEPRTDQRTVVGDAPPMGLGAEDVSRLRIHGMGLCEVALVPPLRTLLIGNGYFGSLYRQRIKESSGYELTAIVDEDATKLTDDAMIVSTSLHDALSNIDLDVAVIATPPSTHATMIERCLTAGLHVFCAKPGGMTYREAAWAHDHATGRRKLFFVDYTMMSAPESNTIVQQFNVLGESLLMQSIRNVVTKPKPEGIILDLLCHDIACFHTMMQPNRVTHVQCDTSERAALAYLYEGERSVAMMNASYDVRTPKKEVSFFIDPMRPITNPRMRIVWNQAQRVVELHSQNKQLDLHFVKHPDPITLALDRFARGIDTPQYVTMLSRTQHEFVSVVCDALQRSVDANAKRIKLPEVWGL